MAKHNFWISHTHPNAMAAMGYMKKHHINLSAIIAECLEQWYEREMKRIGQKSVDLQEPVKDLHQQVLDGLPRINEYFKLRESKTWAMPVSEMYEEELLTIDDVYDIEQSALLLKDEVWKNDVTSRALRQKHKDDYYNAKEKQGKKW